MDMRLVYITAKSVDEARRIGRALVERRLAACVNFWDGMTSLYWWEGRLDESREAVLIAKTSRERVDDLIAEVKRLHTYEVPCVLSVAVEQGNEDYLRWLEGSLSGE